MLILLPPSEVKAAGGTGPRLGRGSVPLSTPTLAAARGILLDAVARLCRDDRDGAVAALHLPPAVADDAIGANRSLRSGPTMAALDRYAGVV